MPSSASFLNAGVFTLPPKTSEIPKPVSSSSTIRMFGAPAGNRCGSTDHFIVESCSDGLTTLSIGVGGKGNTEPSFNGVCLSAECTPKQQIMTSGARGKRFTVLASLDVRIGGDEKETGAFKGCHQTFALSAELLYRRFRFFQPHQEYRLESSVPRCRGPPKGSGLFAAEVWEGEKRDSRRQVSPRSVRRPHRPEQ